jgi:hypothetical protein
MMFSVSAMSMCSLVDPLLPDDCDENVELYILGPDNIYFILIIKSTQKDVGFT